jgi:glycosyltransferase involved in cell wall biosynthesis
LNGKKIVVVMPAFNAERTLRSTYEAIPHEVVDEIVLTDDASGDATAAAAKALGIRTIVHD